MPSVVTLWIALALTQDPTNLQVETAPAPTNVADNTPDFRAQHNAPWSAVGFQLVVTNPAATATIWSVGNGSIASTPTGSFCPEIAFGTGGTVFTPLLWNTPYAWTFRFRGGAMQTTNLVASTFAMGSPAAFAGSGGNGLSGSHSFRSMSFPIAVGTSVPASEIFDDLGDALYPTPIIYRLNEPTRDWVAVGPSDSIEGGRGYLIWSSAGASLDLLAAGVVARGIQTTSNYSFSTLGGASGQEVVWSKPANFYRGFHMIGNPYNTLLTWKPVAAGGHLRTTGPGSTQNVDPSIWKWNGSSFDAYNHVTNMGTASPDIRPLQGVQIHVTSGTNRVSFAQPVHVTVAPSASVLVPQTGVNFWGLRLLAESGGLQDTETIAGIHFEALNDPDPRDTADLPAYAATWMNLGFDLPDRPYCHDFRPTPLLAGDEITWPLVLEGNTNATVTLSWPNLGSLPTSDWQYTLTDPSTSTTVDLSVASSLAVGPLNGQLPLTLKARRLVTFTGGTLTVAAAPGGVAAPAAVVGGTSAVPMLDVLLSAVDEPVTVETFTIQHLGTGDPARVTATLMSGAAVLAGPTAFTGSSLTWTGLTEAVSPDLPAVWTVVYDFSSTADGTYGVQVPTGLAQGKGVYSAVSISAPASTLQGLETLATPAPAAAGGGGSGGCGLLGAEAALLVFGLLLSRRRLFA